MTTYSVVSNDSAPACSNLASVCSASRKRSTGGEASARRTALGAWPWPAVKALDGVSAMSCRAAAATKVSERHGFRQLQPQVKGAAVGLHLETGETFCGDLLAHWPRPGVSSAAILSAVPSDISRSPASKL